MRTGIYSERANRSSASVWAMGHDASWHGFKDIPDDDYALLDPTKVTVVTPGVDIAGNAAESGIPAPLVSRYLREHGVVVEKTGFYSLIGVNPGQSDSLFVALNHFRRDFDHNRLIEDVMLDLYAQFPDRYRDVRLSELATSMHQQLSRAHMARHLEQIYADLPEPAMTPTDAFERLLDGRAELLPLDHVTGSPPCCRWSIRPGFPSLCRANALTTPQDAPSSPI